MKHQELALKKSLWTFPKAHELSGTCTVKQPEITIAPKLLLSFLKEGGRDKITNATRHSLWKVLIVQHTVQMPEIRLIRCIFFNKKPCRTIQIRLALHRCRTQCCNQQLFSLSINLWIIFLDEMSENSEKYPSVMSSNSSFYQSTVQNSKMLLLLSHLTKKNSKSSHWKSWNKGMFA